MPHHHHGWPASLITHPLVVVIDDEAAVREAMESLLASAGMHAVSLGSAEEFLTSALYPAARCLVLDVQLSGISGLQLQDVLLSNGSAIPIVFMSAHDDGDGRLAARALGAGAKAFLRKPFGDEHLVQAVKRALALPSSPMPTE